MADEFPSLRQYKPAVSFTLLSLVFLANLVFATQGGVRAYYLLTSYALTWQLPLYCLLTVLGAAFAHGGKYLMKDLGDMSKMPLSHYFSAHLSVIYATIMPACLAVSFYYF